MIEASLLEGQTATATLFQTLPPSLLSDERGGLFLFYGDPALFALSPLLAAWRLQLGERVLFLDGGNCFSPDPLVRLAKQMGRPPQAFLSSLFVSRAFTCHQMGSLIFNQLKDGLASHHPRLVILANPLKTFYDESVPTIEAKTLLLHLLTALEALVRDRIFVILSPFPRKSAGRRTFFLSHLKERADRIFRVEYPDGRPVDRPKETLQSKIRITEECGEPKTWLLPILE